MEFDPDIFDAVEFGDLDSVKMYWTNKINVDYQDSRGINLLMLAVIFGHEKLVKHLLQFNPNLYLKDNEGKTVFQFAESLIDKTIYNLLLDNCLEDQEKIFLIEYHVKPIEQIKGILGAFVNCWIVDKELKLAQKRSKTLVEENNWQIFKLEGADEIERNDFFEDDEGLKYFNQALIDKEVLVFYTYENEEE